MNTIHEENGYLSEEQLYYISQEDETIKNKIVSDIIDQMIDNVVSLNNKSEIWCCHENCLESVHPYVDEWELKSHIMVVHGRKEWYHHTINEFYSQCS